MSRWIRVIEIRTVGHSTHWAAELFERAEDVTDPNDDGELLLSVQGTSKALFDEWLDAQGDIPTERTVEKRDLSYRNFGASPE